MKKSVFPDKTSNRTSMGSLLDFSERTSLAAAADDGVLLRLERYARAGAAPVLLLHGWMQSPRGMDSPVLGRSLARYLHEQGYDVFIGCMRGHGDGRQRSGSMGHWTPGCHAALDLPAFVRTIRRVNGRSPALVGHSLGGLVSLLYLAGAVRRDGHTGPDAEMARARNRHVPTVCAIAPPLAFPARSIGLFNERPDLAGRMLCRFGASRLGARLLHKVPDVPLQRVVRRAVKTPGLGRALSSALVTAARTNGSRGFWRPENMSREVVLAELTRTLDSTSGAELVQLATWVVAGGLDTRWQKALQHVSSPTLLVAGERDGVSTVDGVVQGSRTLGARDRRLLVIRNAGHNDLRVGDQGVAQLYPALTEWLDQRTGRAAADRTQRAASQPGD